MWNAYKKLNRLEKALKYSGLDPTSINIKWLFDVLVRRGIVVYLTECEVSIVDVS